MIKETLTDRFEDALVYATRLHSTQYRKGTRVPYISHLLAVSSLVMEAGGSEDEAISALLHDCPEDQGGLARLQEITDLYGEAVGAIVAACSDTFEEKKPAWKQRKQDYLDHLREASSSTRLVSCADKLHNARAILTDYRDQGEKLWGRFNADRDDILWYYTELARIFALYGVGFLSKELDRVVAELRSEVSSRTH